MSIEPGAVCFLVGLRHCPDFNGRVVEVSSCAQPWEEEPGLWHTVDAVWLRKMHDDAECIARPENLRPICPPPSEETLGDDRATKLRPIS